MRKMYPGFPFFILALLLSCSESAESQTTAAEPSPRYDPTWESLRQYSAPEWFKDDKFGIFIHWGVYSVPAAGNEWYPRNMYRRDHPLFEHHRKIWGDQGEFGYKEFIPMFKAENWDPEHWVDLFERAGARFIVPVAEHHDGFAMYDSSYTNWDSVEMGPQRDIVGELARAARDAGMKFGVSTHYAHNWHYYTFEEGFDTVNEAYPGLYNKPHPEGEPPSQEHIDHWYARTVELIDRYSPDILWFDFGFLTPEYEEYRKRIAAYYYNRGIEWNKGVVLQYKKDGYPFGVAVLDVERGKLNELRPMVWQTDTSVSTKSWGYIENDGFKTVGRLVGDLVDIVSKNGCLLLNIGPRPDGTIPEEAEQILLGIGQWLSVNGEAVYETRPWHTFGEGPTKSGEHLREKDDSPYTEEDIRYTTRGNNLYAICLKWPVEQLTFTSLGDSSPLAAADIREIQLLGDERELSWNQDEAGLTVQLPAGVPGENAHVLRIKLNRKAMP